MTQPQDNPDRMLSAFADGELDGEQILQMLRRLEQDPALAGRIETEHKLKQAVGRVMSGPEQAPVSLRDAISRLTEQSPSATHADRSEQAYDSPVLAFIGRWIPAAVAAVLFIGALVVFSVSRNTPGLTGPGPLITQANLLNASMVDQFGDRHFKCSRDIATIHGTDQFPQNLAQLPGALSDYFHQPVDSQVLDLSPLGLTFDVAGICILPGKGAVHLIYHTKTTAGQMEALSLWMRPFEEGANIEPDHLYITTPSQETFPMIVWRHGDMVYYLVGDSYDIVERGFKAISNLESPIQSAPTPG